VVHRASQYSFDKCVFAKKNQSINLWGISLKYIFSLLAATSSYISIPPPYTHLYSAGGPTGEVHAVDPSSGGFGEKIQQILFVPDDELLQADKSRVALVSHLVVLG
jgi:hypothetical protein